VVSGLRARADRHRRVNNLLNRDPPACFRCSLNGFNGQTYDVPGIFGYLTATYHVQ
jgi:iron complex outermembrane receptor protein